MKTPTYTIVKNREQYDLYCNRLEYIVENEDSPNEDEIELLSLLIQKYNDEQMKKHQIKLDPVELLVDLLNENKISQSELARRINVSPQLINDIVKYRREITKNIALKLGKEFSTKYYAFLKPYKLKKAS